MSISKAGSWLSSYHSEKISLSRENDIRSVRRSETIAVISGKGGVGKTCLSLKIAQILSEQNKKVLIIDCDSNLSNTGVQLGIPPNQGFLHFLEGRKDFHEIINKQYGF